MISKSFRWSDQWSKEQRQLAGTLARKAIAKGELTRQPCQVCGDTDSLAHHDNYSKPLAITWLCTKCHIQRHRELDPLFMTVRGRRKAKSEDADVGMKYGSANSVRRMFDLPRSLLYELEKQGIIESISLRQPGRRRGKRLWHVGSIEKYLEDQRRKARREAGIVMEVVDEGH